MKGALAVAAAFLALSGPLFPSAAAEDKPGNLSQPAALASPNPQDAVDAPGTAQFDMQASQLRQEIRSLREIGDLRLDLIERNIDKNVSYVEKILLSFLILGVLTVFLFLNSMRHQHRANNFRMRQLIRDSERSLKELRRILEHPDAEHFRVSRNLNNVMHRVRESPDKALPTRMLNDISAATEDPLLPVSLHLQAKALQAEQNGQFLAAVMAWRRLREIDSSNPEVLMHLARAYKTMSELAGEHEAGGYQTLSLQYFQQYSMLGGGQQPAIPALSEIEPEPLAELSAGNGEQHARDVAPPASNVKHAQKNAELVAVAKDARQTEDGIKTEEQEPGKPVMRSNGHAENGAPALPAIAAKPEVAGTTVSKKACK